MSYQNISTYLMHDLETVAHLVKCLPKLHAIVSHVHLNKCYEQVPIFFSFYFTFFHSCDLSCDHHVITPVTIVQVTYCPSDAIVL